MDDFHAIARRELGSVCEAAAFESCVILADLFIEVVGDLTESFR